MASGQKGGFPTGLRVVLVASLALNLLVAGVAVGWWLRHGGGHHAQQPSRLDMAGGPITRALNEEDRRAISHAMRQAWREQGRGRDAMRESMEALLSDLRARPFEAGPVAARLQEQRAAFAARFELGQEVLIGHLSEMSDAERAAFADRLEAQIAAFRKRRGD